jgi:small subunit ribosomal protein S1
MSGSDPKESFASLFESSAEAQRRRARVHRGDRLDVKVVAISGSSVFVDLGGKEEGYFDRGDLADKDGTLRVQIGSSISAVVAETDGERVKLTPVFVRAQSESVIAAGGEEVRIPVGRGGPLLVEGAHVKGTVTGVERYGLFVQIEGTQGRHGRGLVPTAETGTPRGADLRKLFPVGHAVEAKILAIAEDGKIRLSIKALGEDAERGEFEAYARGRDASDGEAEAAKPGERRSAEKKAAPKKPEPRNFGTLGDLLKGGGAAPSKKK